MRNADLPCTKTAANARLFDVTPSSETFQPGPAARCFRQRGRAIDFIRKAARDFLNTASPQDRISIISFHDDIKIIFGLFD